MSDPGATKATTVATSATLGRAAAIWNALLWRNVDFYPRIAQDGAISTLDTVSVVQEMEMASARWPTLDDNQALKIATDFAKQSLAEVKAQTEYQDQKATRLLTITTILSALSGALFSRFEDAYPIDTVTIQPLGSALLLGFGYATFVAFVIASLSGALVTFHATRTRFKYPPYQTIEEQERDPESLLFYGGLIRSRPRAWMRGWVTAGANGDAEDKLALRGDLQQRYFRHLVSETYLVAAKTADKLRYLEPPQSLLAISLRCLFLWLLLLASISMLIPPTKRSAQQPIQVTVVPGLLQSSSPVSALSAKSLAVPVVGEPSTIVRGQHP
jgi:hypothetical protein